MTAQYLKYAGTLELESRRDTKNAADIPTSSQQRGIASKDFIRYLNYGMKTLERKLTVDYPEVFHTHKDITVTAGTSEYTIADNLYFNLRIKRVEWSRSGNVSDLRPLEWKSNIDVNRQSGNPYYWHRKSVGVVVLEPAPVNAGLLRVYYQRTLDSMALRKAELSALTVTNGILTGSLTISKTGTNVDAAVAELQAAVLDPGYVCISDKFGVVKAYNIPITSYTVGGAATDFIAITDTAVVDSASPPAVGDFITIGQYTTTHGKLPETCEQYLIEYANSRIKIRSSAPSDWQALEMKAKEVARDIIAIYRQTDPTVQHIPIMGAGADMLYWDEY